MRADPKSFNGIEVFDAGPEFPGLQLQLAEIWSVGDPQFSDARAAQQAALLAAQRKTQGWSVDLSDTFQ